MRSKDTYLCNAGYEPVKAGGGAHLLGCDHEAALLLVIAQQHIQVAFHCVERFGAADVSFGTALVFSHKFHEHHDELVDGLVIDARVLGQQILDDGVILRRRSLPCKRG